MTIPAVRFRIDFGQQEAVGPGKIALLERIGERGSLAQAARDLKMSYRRAWQLLESVNGCFREPLVLTSRGGHGGGGAELTALGRQLIRVYRRFDRQLQSRAARTFRPLAQLARGAQRATDAAPILRLSGR
ncbi:MAG TPA: LysR family transcriptional regulator [Steroidobacteraceae bacterium]|nr:LysR family transcriptional regulator [Steroidobacteraceae bacterium]